MFNRVGSHDLPIPFPQTHGSAGYDLQAADDYTLHARYHEMHAPVLVKAGFSVTIPKGMVGMVCSRSGLALKSAVAVLNAPGIIDSDYQGEIGVILMNFGRENFSVKVGDRIAQLVIVPCHAIPTLLSRLGRGEGGFGSTDA